MRYVDPHLQAVIAEGVRRCREAAGLTQRDVAEAVGLHPATVLDIEKARRRVHLDEAPALCEALDCTITDLLES